MADKGIVAVGGERIFENTPCVLIGFEFNFTKAEDFRFEDFAKETTWHEKARFRNVCSSQHKATDYHLHLNWRITPPNSVTVQVDYRAGYKSPNKDEKEPFAENFLAWFRQFISARELTLETYGNFDFPLDAGKRFSFPLPMKVPIGANEAEIDGISFTLIRPKDGLEKFWVTRGSKDINFHVHGKKNVIVASLEPRREIAEMVRALESLFE